MNIEEQVCSLEYAKKLKELYIKKESHFAYFLQNPLIENWELSLQTSSHIGLPAYTASELIEILPHRIIQEKNEPFNSFTLRVVKSYIVEDKIEDNKKEGKFYINPKLIYIINYYCESTHITSEDAWLQRGLFEHNIWDKNFCNALAKTLIKIF